MAHEPFFPITASASWVLGTFAVCLLLFHIIFIECLKLSAIQWKRIDYVWLGLATLGLLIGVSEVRRTFAEGQIGVERSLVQSRFDDVRREVRFLTGNAVCRQFVRSAWSPANLDASQQEYDAVCEFAKQVQKRIPLEPPANLASLGLTERPRVTDLSLLDMLKGLDERSDWYLHARKTYEDTVVASKQTELEGFLTVLAPLLLALALALRITKVTGEIRLQA